MAALIQLYLLELYNPVNILGAWPQEAQQADRKSSRKRQLATRTDSLTGRGGFGIRTEKVIAPSPPTEGWLLFSIGINNQHDKCPKHEHQLERLVNRNHTLQPLSSKGFEAAKQASVFLFCFQSSHAPEPVSSIILHHNWKSLSLTENG